MNTSLAGVALLGFSALTLAAPATAAAQVPGGADSVRVSAAAEPVVAHPGGEVSIAVALEHAAGFHSWPREPVVPPEFAAVNPIATTIEVISLPEGVVVESIEWPEAVPVIVRYTRRPVELLSYIDTAVAHVRLQLSDDATLGPANLEIRVRHQSCDERFCYPPRTVTLSVPFRIEAPGG
jgi:DsbC/DsbD-like thiol-disulfide interchange protein